MITKKKKEKETSDQEIGHASRNLPPPPYSSHTFTNLPRFVSGSNPSPTSPRFLPLMADPHHIPPGKPAFGRLSAVNFPLPSRSGTPSIEQPLAFLAQQHAQARHALRLPWQDLPDFNPETLSGTLLPESTTLCLLAQLVRGLVTISPGLTGVTQALTTISLENEAIREELHDVSSQLAYLPPPQDQNPPQAVASLQAYICDRSHRMSAPTPAPPPSAVPICAAPPPFIVQGPGPSSKGKGRAQATPTPTPNANEDPKYLILFYNTKLGKAFGDPEKYARLYPHTYEAGQY